MVVTEYVVELYSSSGSGHHGMWSDKRWLFSVPVSMHLTA